ncbi:monocarboxylate transporter 9-like [Stegodyphus dumicola]|uniref:monocarboxylate transporter 9-like n=1 Tax=Stegodyphus dumicola TaxID=202533 RepID=UPI0015ABD5C0|nr:monocarboxylate transporter 9-like [Stegodyphus dumicola]
MWGVRSNLCQKQNESEVEPSEEDPLLGAELKIKNTAKIKRPPKKRFIDPNGPQSWMAAFANFFINFIIIGFGRMSGIFYVVFMDTFHVGRQVASVPFSVQQSASNLFGPLAAILGQKYNIRSVVLAGGLIGSISAVSCFYKTDITWITISWGLVFGISTALTTHANQVFTDLHFKKHQTTAVGLAYSGGCVGAFFFPVLIEMLIKFYNLPGTFLIIGAIILNVIPASILLKEPTWMSKHILKQKSSKQSAKRKKSKAHSDENKNPGINALTNPQSKSFTVKVSENNYFDFEHLRKNSGFVYQLLELFNTSYEMMEHQILTSKQLSLIKELIDICQAGQQQGKTQFFQPEIMLSSPHPEENLVWDSFQENKTVNFDEYHRLKIFSKLRRLYEKSESEILSHFNIHNHGHVLKVVHALRNLYELLQEGRRAKKKIVKFADAMKEKETLSITNVTKKSEEYNNAFRNNIKTAIKLHSKPLFLLICLCRGVFTLTFIPFVTIIVDFAMDKGMKREEAKYVIAILSLGDLIGRLCLGWVTESSYLSLPRYMLVVMLLLSISMSTFPLMSSALAIIPGILVFGMLQGSLFIRHQSLVTMYMENQEQSIGLGFINLFSGFLGLALPAYIGYFRDTHGSYDNMFYVNSCICAMSGLLWILEPFFIHFSPKHSKYDKLEKQLNR